MIIMNDLNYSRGKKMILNNISGVFSGSVGIYGENGAGKSTLLMCLALLEKPKSGNIRYEGNEYKAPTIGYLPQSFNGFQNQSILNNLNFFASSKTTLGRKKRNYDVVDKLKKLYLLDDQNKKLKELSGGTLRRVGIAQALLSNPNILVLDEPTIGLDLLQQFRLRILLRRIKQKGTKLVICSHNLEDLMLCDNIIFLKDGTVKNTINLKELVETKMYFNEFTVDSIENLKKIEEKSIIESIDTNGKIKVKVIVEGKQFDSLTRKLDLKEKLEITLKRYL